MTRHKSRVLVYKGRGVGPLSFRETLTSLRGCLSTEFQVTTCSLEDLVKGDVLQDAGLFALPGGRDVPYDEDLRGAANANLRRFVEEGGGFLGICAGAYYGASRVIFEEGFPLEVMGSRELAFFPGDAVGTVYKPGQYIYDSEECAQAALLQVGSLRLHAYYNGGCYFRDALDYAPSVRTMGFYQDAPNTPLAAIVECQVGKGTAILSGPHLDYRASALKGKISNNLLDPLMASDEQRELLLKRFVRRLLNIEGV